MDFQKKPKWDAWSIKRQTPMFLAESGKDGNPGCEGLLSKAQSPGGVSPDTQLQPDQNFKAKKKKKKQTKPLNHFYNNLLNWLRWKTFYYY